LSFGLHGQELLLLLLLLRLLWPRLRLLRLLEVAAPPLPAPCRHQPAPACEWSDLRPTSKPTACLSLPRRCGPCRAAFPHLSQLQHKHGAAGLAVVGVSMEEDSPQLRAFVAQQVRQAAGVQLQWLVPVCLPPAWLSGEGRQGMRGQRGMLPALAPLPTLRRLCACV
jgi:hypothetical protein